MKKEINKLSEIEINFEMNNGQQEFYATFLYDNGSGIKTKYSCDLIASLIEDYDDYTEGGYVVGQSISFEWIVEDLINVFLFQKYKDENGVICDDDESSVILNPDLILLFQRELSNFMSGDGKFNYYDVIS